MTDSIDASAVKLLETGIRALEAIIQKHEFKLERLTEILQQMARDQEKIARLLRGDDNGKESLLARIASVEFWQTDIRRQVGENSIKISAFPEVAKRVVEEEFLRRGAADRAEEAKESRAFRGKMILQVLAHLVAIGVALIAILK